MEKELFEWVKATPENLPVGRKSIPLRWQDDTGTYFYDTGYVDLKGGFGEKILFVASAGWYKIKDIEFARSIPQSSLKEEDWQTTLEKESDEMYSPQEWKENKAFRNGAEWLFDFLNKTQSSLTPKLIRDSDLEKQIADILQTDPELEFECTRNCNCHGFHIKCQKFPELARKILSLKPNK